MCFLVLLIIEHPQITPSWLVEWKLFNNKGEITGIKQSGEQYIAISYKHRKGSAKSQQIVILNDRSKAIIDNLIEYTSQARSWMRENGDHRWRYMCIYANGITSTPRVLGTVENVITPNSKFIELFSTKSIDKNGNTILEKQDAVMLAKEINLRPVRSSRAIQIYLNTLSVTAMSKALGHADYDPHLLNRYIPDLVLEFFHNRWIRIFQNAIIYEAMKDSEYLFMAVDFNEKELDEFLTNHSLGKLPEHLMKGKEISENNINAEPEEIKDGIDDLVVTLSTPILQVLIAVNKIVETAELNETLPKVIEKWYEVASFILKQLDIECSTFYRINPEIEDIYKKARLNPIDHESMKECLLCN